MSLTSTLGLRRVGGEATEAGSLREDLTHHCLHILGVEVFGHGSETGEIAEYDCHMASFGSMRALTVEFVATVAAEASALRILETTVELVHAALTSTVIADQP
jgi:hypothetical protein